MILEKEFERLTNKPVKDWTKKEVEDFNDFCKDRNLVYC